MHVPATLQNGLARMMTGVSRSLKPSTWLAGIAALFAVALLAVIVPAVVFAATPAVPGWPDKGAVTSGDCTMNVELARRRPRHGLPVPVCGQCYRVLLGPRFPNLARSEFFRD